MSYFDHFATSPMTPVGHWMVLKLMKREFALIAPFIPNHNSAILEIGPGRGELAELFRAAGYHNYTVVEPNTLMREYLAKHGFAVKNYMIPGLQESDATYDVIILSDVFEHLNDARDALTFVGEAKRVLRNGGIVCIGAPDYLHWNQDFFNADFSHANISTVRRTRQLFANSGLKTLKYVYLSGFLSGLPATLFSNLVRICFFFLHPENPDNKLYKLKLTFLRRFLIIGGK